jgi:hypothetical protein
VRIFTFTRWGGSKQTVEADRVSFEPTHVAFWRDGGDHDVLVLAERPENVNGLKEEA